MAITDYSSLQQAIQDWMDRTDIAGTVPDMISLAEAELNREIGLIETNVTLTGTAGSRTIDISAYSIVEPVTLKLHDTFREWDMVPRENGTIDYGDTSARPSMWSIDGTDIVFDCPLDQNYDFRFRYRGRFALSDTAPTNKLLTDHPDLYMAASIVWGGLFTEDDRKISMWRGLLERVMPQVKSTLNQSRRGQLTVDPALARIGRYNRNLWGWWV